MTFLGEIYEILRDVEVFPNQTIFYNCLFGFIVETDYYMGGKNGSSTRKTHAIDLVKKDLKIIYQNQEGIKLEENNTKKIYSIISGHQRETELERFFPNLKGDVITNQKSNQNSVINGKRAIPQCWRRQFEVAEKSLDVMEYALPLADVIQYVMVLSSQNAFEYRNNEPKKLDKYPDYIEYFSFTNEKYVKIRDKVRNSILYTYEIKKLVDKGIDSIADIATIIFYAIQQQCVLKELLDYSDMTKDMCSMAESGELREQYEFYSKNIDCYGHKSIDRFNMLRRYAKTNVYCASELGSIYYYGDRFYAGKNIYYIKRNYKEAANYYKLCCNNPILPNGCWSFGRMIFTKNFDLNDEDRLNYSENYFQRCGEYGPAYNSLGLVEKERGDILLEKVEKIEFSQVKEEDRNTIIEHYVKFFEYTSRATEENWLYGYNNQFAFLRNQRYQKLLQSLKEKMPDVEFDCYMILDKSVEMGNPWAMDKLAVELLQNRDKVNSHIRDKYKSKDLLKSAHEMNYAKASYHLAIYFYKNTDKRKYFNLIKIAADNEYPDAYKELKHMEDKNE